MKQLTEIEVEHWFDRVKDFPWAAEEIDPDWRDHFLCAEAAVEWYLKWDDGEMIKIIGEQNVESG